MFVAMDCEMVKSRNKLIIARVSIVDRQGDVLLNEYVKPTAVVTDYMTHISGITQKHLDNGKPLPVVQNLVAKLIKKHILVGHSLQNDLKCLGLSHPVCNRRDLAKFGPFKYCSCINKGVPTSDYKNVQPLSLKDLAKKYLKKTIQDGEHDSVTDAQTAMELYNKVADVWN